MQIICIFIGTFFIIREIYHLPFRIDENYNTLLPPNFNIEKLNTVNYGDTEYEIYHKIGYPLLTSNEGEYLVLSYSDTKGNYFFDGVNKEYFFILKNGKMVSKKTDKNPFKEGEIVTEYGEIYLLDTLK